MTCTCRPQDGITCQFHARQPRPCACGGVLQYYRGKDGGQVQTFIATRGGYIIAGVSRTFERHVGAAWLCNRCEHCEAA